MVYKAKYLRLFGAGLTGAILAAGIALSGCARQSPEAPQGKAEAVESTSTANSTGGDNAVRAYIDPATGKLREPTPEEIAAQNAAEAARKKTADAASEKTTEPKEVRLPNGAIQVELGESGQTTLQGCVTPSGEAKMDRDCESKQDGKKK